MTAGARAGDLFEASMPSFPAATATKMPALKAAVTAASIAVDGLPPRDMLITDLGFLLRDAALLTAI
jgi:hypothetical protein